MRWTALFAGILMTLSALPGPAATFKIDPSRTHVEMSGTMAGFTIQEQGPGSLRTTVSGALLVEESAGSVRFPGGSLLDANTNGVWQPLPDGTTGAAPADLAARLTTPFGPARLALRNIALDITSSQIPVSNGQFAAASLVFRMLTNTNPTLDFNSPVGSDSQPLGGSSTNVAATASLTGPAGARTLTIPVDATFIFDGLQPRDSQARFVGLITAVEEVPAAAPRFTRIEVIGSTVRLHVTGAAPSAVLRSSADFVRWGDRVAEVTVDGGTTIYSVTAGQSREFFRILQP